MNIGTIILLLLLVGFIYLAALGDLGKVATAVTDLKTKKT